MTATLDGLKLFAYNVFPSLFPFFILTRILTNLGLGESVAKFVGKPLSKLFGTSALGCYVFVLSILSGYPVGAKMVSEYVKSGKITLEEAKKIISFTSTSGPLFIVGAIGVNLIGDVKVGYAILISHFVGAFLNGLLYKGKNFSTQEVSVQVECEDILSDALSSSITSIFQVGASIIFLNVLIVALKDLKVISVFSGLLSYFISDILRAEALAIGCVEITKGAQLLCSLPNKKDIIVSLSTIISFGGVSVMVQSMTFLRAIGIKTSYYLLTKISQAILTYAVSTLIVLFLY